MEISIQLILRCNKCGSDLDAVYLPSLRKINVDPCAICIDAACDNVIQARKEYDQDGAVAS